MDNPLAPAILVIGYGSLLRADDGAGQGVAAAVAAWGLPGVTALAVHQLTPELAEPLASARLAIFVDARLAGAGEEARAQRLDPAPARAAAGHTSDPRSLMALARMAFGRCPAAWSITVPATDFTLGGSPSPTAERGMEDALRRIGILVGRAAGNRPDARSRSSAPRADD